MNPKKRAGLTILALAVAAMAYVGLTDPPRLPISAADGSFSNACCGTITFRQGLLTFKGRQVRYVVESDKIGAYILPERYVGVGVGGLVFRAVGSNPLKLRLNKPEAPQRVEIFDDSPDGRLYVFNRIDGS